MPIVKTPTRAAPAARTKRRVLQRWMEICSVAGARLLNSSTRSIPCSFFRMARELRYCDGKVTLRVAAKASAMSPGANWSSAR